jgi:hypothetical protein
VDRLAGELESGHGSASRCYSVSNKEKFVLFDPFGNFDARVVDMFSIHDDTGSNFFLIENASDKTGISAGPW